jgi:hypothetical protein
MALGFETHRIDHRIYPGIADDRGHLLAKAIVFGEIYRTKPNFLAGLTAPRSYRQS